MAWRDNLLEAALDGVPFFYEEAEIKVGRRVEVHEFPGRDEPYAEDLGRAARKWGIRAYVIGENYASRRDELIEAIESPGTHTFTHPYRGDVTVRIVGEVTFSESTKEGRQATFDLQLVEAGLDYPIVLVPTAPTVKAQKAEALDGLASKTKLSLIDAIAAVLGSVADAFNEAASLVRAVNGKIAAALNLVDNITASIDAFAGEVADLFGTPQDAVNKFVALYDALFRLVTDFSPPAIAFGVRDQVFDMIDVVMTSLRSLIVFEATAVAIPTPTQQSTLEHEAVAQVQATARAAALATAAAVLVTLSPDSAQQATDLADELAGYFDLVLEAPLDVAVHETFATMKATTIEHFVELSQRLPALTTYVPPMTLPALVLAYDLYTDPDREDDIVRRNAIRHPLFVAGGIELEVLADA